MQVSCGHAKALNNLANALSDVGRDEDALAVAGQAVLLHRRNAESGRPDCLKDLATCLSNMANRNVRLRRYEDALAHAEEAVDLLGRAGEDAVARRERRVCLYTLGGVHSALGQHEEARLAFRSCASLLLEPDFADPYQWAGLCTQLARGLDETQDLRDWYLPLVRVMSEFRELAWDSQLATALLDLQARVAARVWSA